MLRVNDSIIPEVDVMPHYKGKLMLEEIKPLKKYNLLVYHVHIIVGEIKHQAIFLTETHLHADIY